MSVVLRCQTCGTTQGKPGECEACSDGTVRYFCDNHTPGLWLDTPVCKACGATFGKTAPRRPEPGSPAAASVPVHRTRRPGAVGPGTSRRRERPYTGTRPPTPLDVEPDDAPAGPSLRDLLAHLSRGAGRPPLEVDDVARRIPEREAPARAPFLGGCLLRLLLLALLLIVLAVTGVLVFLGSIFQ